MRFLLSLMLMVEKNWPCPDCGHARNQHSRNGCTSCPCTRKYMDW